MGGSVLNVECVRSRGHTQNLTRFLASTEGPVYSWSDDASVGSLVGYVALMDQRFQQPPRSRRGHRESVAAEASEPPISEPERTALARQLRTMVLGGPGPLPWCLVRTERTDLAEIDFSGSGAPRYSRMTRSPSARVRYSGSGLVGLPSGCGTTTSVVIAMM